MNPMETVILKLKALGFFQFLLPFMLTSAVFYGALRKSKIFGDPDRSIIINGVIALVASFMVWAYPILAGVDVETRLASFFAQGMAVTMVTVLGLIISGLFLPPDLPKTLSDKLKTARGYSLIIIVGIVLGFVVLVTSGLIGIFLPQGFSIGSVGGDWVGIAIVAAMMIGTVAVIVYMSSSGGSKSAS